jgi:hypothetical protein
LRCAIDLLGRALQKPKTRAEVLQLASEMVG